MNADPRRPRHLPGLLDAELCGHDGAGPGVGERDHGRGTAVDESVADLLGHHERVDQLLCHSAGAGLLQVGVRVAAVPYCDGVGGHCCSARTKRWDSILGSLLPGVVSTPLRCFPFAASSCGGGMEKGKAKQAGKKAPGIMQLLR